jgi:hypothetical protein
VPGCFSSGHIPLAGNQRCHPDTVCDFSYSSWNGSLPGRCGYQHAWAYFTESAVAHVFGESALGWRFFDFSLLAAAALAIGVILKPYGRFAGLFAEVCFALTHGSDGVPQAGQRDLVIAVLLIAGYACCFEGVRRKAWAGIVLFGFCCGCAVAIKLPAPIFFIGMLPLVLFACRRFHLPGVLCMCGYVAGFLIPVAAALVFLVRNDALAVFLSMTQKLIVFHAELGRHTALFLIAHAIPATILPLMLLAAWLAGMRREWLTWEQSALLLGACIGFASFCAQGKAYPYHRYPLMVFLWVLIAGQFSVALRSAGKRRTVAVVGILYAVLWVGPSATAKSLRYNWRDERSLAQLRSDLDQAGGAALVGDVQCMDTTSGCLMALNDLKLRQATGFLYDCYFFSPENNPVKAKLRGEFWRRITDVPPKVFVITDQWCFDQPRGYGKLDQWPEFERFLSTNYSLSMQRECPEKHNRYVATPPSTPPFGYRIYSIKAR